MTIEPLPQETTVLRDTIEMPATSPQNGKIGRRYRRFIWIFTGLIVAVTSGFCLAYFADAQLDGNVRFLACACGYADARVSDGQVILKEANHDNPTGTVMAYIETDGRACTITRVSEGSRGRPAEFQLDHLGAKYYYEGRAIYVVMDNWKYYPAGVFAWMGQLLE